MMKMLRSRPTIGLLIHGVTSLNVAGLRAGVAKAAEEQDANLLHFVGRVLNSPAGYEAQGNVLYKLAGPENVDGLVIWSSVLGLCTTSAEIKRFCEHYHPLPVVSVGETLEGIPSVTVDNYQSMRQVLVHLVEFHGYRRLAFIRGPQGHYEADERYRAYVDVLAEYGLPFDADLVVPGEFLWPATLSASERAVSVLLERRKVDFEAVVAANDYMALSVLKTLQVRGIRVPEDVAVAGFDDVEESRWITPPLTTTSLMVYEQGYRAAEIVLDQLKGRQVPEQVVVAPKLAVRQSCGCLSPSMAQPVTRPAPARAGRDAPAETLEAGLSARRERILSELAQAMGTAPLDHYEMEDSGRAKQLFDAFLAELAGRQPDAFLPALEQLLRRTALAGGDVAGWQGVISALRQSSLPGLGDAEAIFQAENLWQQARLMIGEAAQRVQAYHRLQTGQQVRLLNEVGQQLVTTFDVQELMGVVAQNLPRLGIERCYLSLYECDSTPEEGPPSERSRLVLAYDERGRVDLEKGEQVFLSRQLVPAGMLDREQRYNIIVEPLYFQDDQLGFVLFEPGMQEGIIYETLQGQLSSALKGALLFTERRQAEEAFRREEERFRLVVSSISDHIYVTEITENGEHINLYVSPHAETLTGYPLEKFTTDWRFWPSSVIHPDDKAAAAAQAARLAGGQDCEMEYRLVRADGQIIWVRDSGRVQDEGTSKIIYGVVSDITARKRAELERQWLTNELRDVNQTLDERVQARTAELQAILDAAGEGIVVTDLNGVIQYVNPALERMTGYSDQEALDQTPRLWKSDKQDDAFYAKMWRTILAGQTWRGELVNRRKDGSHYDLLLTITPIPGPYGRPTGFVGVQSDITPFKEMDRMKTEFISTAAHELRTPLTSIVGFSEILLTRELGAEQRRRYLTFINEQSNALAAIIDDLLDLTRLEAGRGFEINTTLVDLKEIAQEVLFAFGENNPEHHYRLIGPDTWPPVKGDPAKLGQLLKNLFDNATKYSLKGGEVTLEARHEEQYGLLHLTLTDRGIGMTQDQLAHIFDRFYRADASNTAIGGTGLGMTISQLITERHKGKIWVESEYGAGTTVHVILPLPNRSPHILIIEDDESLRTMERRSLEAEGYAVLAAAEGRLGLELAQTCLPNLILLDLLLPKISGFKVLEELQTNYLTRDIPVIVTSAIDRPEQIEKAIEMGATDYQVKPYLMADLLVRINWTLNRTSI